MRFFVATIFPQIVECYASYGMVHRAVKKGLLEVHPLDLRNFADNPREVDDEPYGGFPGMVLKPEPIFRAYDFVVENYGKPFVVATEPWGERITQKTFEELKDKELVFVICGRYEGVDERVKKIVDKEVSLGDFILSGGELPALVLIDGTARLLEGVLSEPQSLAEDSFKNRWLGYPVYTRPAEFRGMKVPEVLRSGDHKLVELWKLYKRIEQTVKKRPDLVPPEEDLSEVERKILDSVRSGKSFEEFLKEEKKLVRKFRKGR
ncbi:MAG: tRNA (guanosine(37)-N1)-methyltransferase TrmD [Aquificae bacterium]|nr:tRNA (guanosine(37)-N1)-methyltransferase TrmD [Aquificota bacterium]